MGERDGVGEDGWSSWRWINGRSMKRHARPRNTCWRDETTHSCVMLIKSEFQLSDIGHGASQLNGTELVHCTASPAKVVSITSSQNPERTGRKDAGPGRCSQAKNMCGHVHVRQWPQNPYKLQLWTLSKSWNIDLRRTRKFSIAIQCMPWALYKSSTAPQPPSHFFSSCKTVLWSQSWRESSAGESVCWTVMTTWVQTFTLTSETVCGHLQL